MIDLLAATANDCLGVAFPLQAHASSFTYPAAIAAVGYWWREGVVGFLKDFNREL